MYTQIYITIYVSICIHIKGTLVQLVGIHACAFLAGAQSHAEEVVEFCWLRVWKVIINMARKRWRINSVDFKGRHVDNAIVTYVHMYIRTFVTHAHPPN